MHPLVQQLFGAAAITLGVGLVWRFAARRRSLPCPAWLGWLLENPYMDTVAGSSLLVERLDLAPGMRVLDVGCGPGRLALPVAERIGPEGEVVALDTSAEMLSRLEERRLARGLSNVRAVRAKIEEGPITRDYFDRALLVTVLGEIPDRDGALAAIYAALKPGGLLSVTEVLPDPHYQRLALVRHLAEAAGFSYQAVLGGGLAYTANFAKPVG